MNAPPTAARLPVAASCALLAVGIALATGSPAHGQPPNLEKAQFAVQADRTAYLPGETVELLVTMEIEDGWHTNSSQPTYEYLIATDVMVAVPDGWEPATVRYPPGEMKSFAFADERISVYEGVVEMTATLSVPAGFDGDRASVGVELIYQACDDRSCLAPVSTSRDLELTVGPGGTPTQAFVDRPSVSRSAPTSAPTGKGPGLVWMLIFGLIGGLILNAMPCVLPVLSIKIFGMVKSAGLGRREVIAGSLATTAGIVFSFWALGSMAILAKAGGAAVGWGVQFQEPTFVAALAVIVVLFCLNLWGVFEVPLPRSLATAAGGVSSEGMAGHFTSGLFATLMATPCSAPFLGTAIGFALSQSAATILAIFTAVGVGMALPYLALAAAPGAANLLPRPGPWMDRLRVVMGFLLAGAAVWLLYVLAAQISAERLAFFQLALLVMALLVWLRQSAAHRPWTRRLLMVAVVVSALLGIGLAYSAEPDGGGMVAETPQLIQWVTFDRAEAEQLGSEDRLVFVDVTADWCFTCKVNERLALETDPVAEAFERHGVIAMKADWTNRSEAIAQYLADHGRYGIPFYLLYRPAQEPHLFGELISSREIVEIVEEAAARKSSGS
jgi:suppressor for copper-sensitivity B